MLIYNKIIKYNGLSTHVRQIAHENIISIHCFIHCKQLAANDMNENLFDKYIKLIHFN